MITVRKNSIDILHKLSSLYLLAFVASISHSMMVTLFVPMLMHPSAFLDDTVVRSIRTTYVGLLVAIYPMGTFIGGPIIGSFSDRYGRKRVISVSMAVTILFFIVISYSLEISSLKLLLAACFLAGLFDSGIAIAQSAVADSSAKDERGRLFAYLFAVRSLGYLLGPLIGGQIAADYGYALPFWMLVSLMVISYIWIMAGFHDTFKPDKKMAIDYFQTFTNLVTVFTDLPIRRVYLVNFLLFLSAYGLWRVIQIYMIDKWDFDVAQVTFYYSYLAAIAIAANIFLFAPLANKLGLKWTIISTAVLGGLFMLTIVVPNSEVFYWFTAGPTTLCLSITLAGCGAYLSTLVDTEKQGKVLGNNLALQVGAESSSALIGGVLAAVMIPIPLISLGVIAILGGLLLIPYKKPK